GSYPYTVTVGTGASAGTHAGNVVIAVPAVISVPTFNPINRTSTPGAVIASPLFRLGSTSNQAQAANARSKPAILGAATAKPAGERAATGVNNEKSGLNLWWLIALIIAAITPAWWFLVYRRKNAEQDA